MQKEGLATEANLLPFLFSVNLLTAPMDFTAFSSRVLTFPIDSVGGDQQCTNVMINNDNVVEASGEMFFVNLASSDADIVPGRERATITIDDTDRGTLYARVVFCCG